jgi:hypothetical protein
MHPVVKGFLDSMSVPQGTSHFLKTIEEIRTTQMLSIMTNGYYSGQLDFSYPLGELLEGMDPELPIDVYFNGFGYTKSSAFRIFQILKHYFGAYNLLVSDNIDEGFLLALGARELVLCENAAFYCWQPSIADNDSVRVLDEVDYFRRHFPEADLLDFYNPNSFMRAFAERERERKKLLKTAAPHLSPEDLDDILDAYFKRPLGEGSLSRYDLKELGFDVCFGEDSGVGASLKETGGCYEECLAITTVIEGTHQGDGGHIPANYSFRAKSEILAIVETALRRFICFRLIDLPPDNKTELVWFEK